ncbi:MAG: glycosyltransferase [Lachnospiraceae bacterium]|nr:glycosyltransferase [Lachnospiraceae bacterium]
MAADWKTQAKTEYEAELYRQTHPYEQWIADNEPGDGSVTQFRGETPDDFLVLTQYYFRGLLEGHAEDEMRKRPFGINADSRLEQEPGETAAAVDRILKGKDYALVVEFEPGLDPRAFDVIRSAFREHPEVDVIYADEDVIDAEGKRSHPWFKPDWSPDTFRSFKYFGHIVAYRATCIRKMVRDEQWDPVKCDPTEFAIRVSAGRPLHLPQVLFHNRCDDPLGKEDVYQKVWRTNSYENPSYPIEIKEEQGPGAGNGRPAKVSVIIPSKDQPKLLEQCLKGLRENTDYPDFEIIVVDNGSSDANRAEIEKLRDRYGFQYLYEKEDFNFSRMCNRGAAAASGELLLFLNDDIEVFGQKSPWMKKMAGQALLSHVGAVGAKLWYPWQEGENKRMPPKNCRIQHCGITNIALGPVHKMGGMEDKGNIYHFRNRATYNTLAVTAACLMVRREKFDGAGGFDENLAVAYNDMDFCFSLYEKGWYNVVRADAVLIHHESASRGSDESPEKRRRREAELEKLYRKHPALYGRDPFYSPHLVQERLDVDYHLGYAYPYEKAEVRSEITPVTAAEYSMGLQGYVWRKLGVDLQILQHIDDVRRRVRFTAGVTGRVIRSVEYQIEGWAAPARKTACLYARSLLLVREDGSGYRISVFDKHRTDTKEILAEQETWELAGFVARVPGYSLADGEYRVLLSFVPKAGGRAFVMDSGAVVELKKEEIRLKRETVG